jgi:hypothetical protein
MDLPEFNAPDVERVYRNYLATCRRLGIKPVLRGHARELMAEWSVALAGRRSAPPNTH